MTVGVLARGGWLPLVLFLGFALVPWLAGDGFMVSLVGRVMIFALVALSLDLILGVGGLASLGHAAFIGIGAYAVGIGTAHDVYEGLVTIPLGLLAAGLFALVTGAISLRTRGVYFIMITLAFGQMAFFTATSLSVYGGDDGLTLWGRTELAGQRWLEDDITLYYTILGCLLGSFLLLRAVVRSRFGRVLQATRQNPARVAALGLEPFRYRLTAYVIAGMLASLGGMLLANHTEFVSPAYMTWQRSGELIVMVVLGGMGTLSGAILGAVSFMLLEEYLAEITQHWRLIFGPLLILVVLYARGGLARFLGAGGDA